MSDCNEAALEYLAEGNGTSVPDLTGQSALGEDEDGCGDQDDSSPLLDESKANEDNSEEVEESQPPPKGSRLARRTPVFLSDTMVVAAESSVTYEEAVRGSKKNKWKLALKKQLDIIENNNAWMQNVLLLGKEPILSEVVLKREIDEQRNTALYKARPVTKGYVQKDEVDNNHQLASPIPLDVHLLTLQKMYISALAFSSC